MKVISKLIMTVKKNIHFKKGRMHQLLLTQKGADTEGEGACGLTT